MPLDERFWRGGPEQPRRPKREHLFDAYREVCLHCGITGQALLSYPGTPCDVIEAAKAEEALRVELKRIRQRNMEYRRGSF